MVSDILEGEITAAWFLMLSLSLCNNSFLKEENWHLVFHLRAECEQRKQRRAEMLQEPVTGSLSPGSLNSAYSSCENLSQHGACYVLL